MVQLAGFFDFDGRLDRLSYLFRCAPLAAVVWAAAAMGRSAMAVELDNAGFFGVHTWSEWGMAFMLILSAWAALALSCRRLRDMGAEPAWVAPIYGFFSSAGVELSSPWIRLAPPLDQVGPAGVVLGLSAIPLLLWPSRAGAAKPVSAPSFEPSVHTAYVDWRNPAQDQ